MSNNKNLVFVCYYIKYPSDLITTLNEFKKEYDYEIQSYKIGDPLEIKTPSNNKLILIIGESKNELLILRAEYNMIRNKIKDSEKYKEILICPDVSEILTNIFKTDDTLSLDDKFQLHVDLRRILSTEFKEK